MFNFVYRNFCVFYRSNFNNNVLVTYIIITQQSYYHKHNMTANIVEAKFYLNCFTKRYKIR